MYSAIATFYTCRVTTSKEFCDNATGLTEYPTAGVCIVRWPNFAADYLEQRFDEFILPDT